MGCGGSVQQAPPNSNDPVKDAPEVAKPAEEVKPAVLPVVETTPEANSAEEVKPAQEAKSVEEAKPTEEAKPAEEVKPAEGAKPAEAPAEEEHKLSDDELKKANEDPAFIKEEMSKCKGKDDKEMLKRVAAIMKGHTKRCGPQGKESHEAAKKMHEEEKGQFAAKHPKPARAYAELSADAARAEKLPAVAFYIGFCEGLAKIDLEPCQVFEKMESDWAKLKEALHNFVTHKSFTHHHCTMEDHHLVSELESEFGGATKRAEALVHELKPVVTLIAADFKKGLDELYMELAGPLLVIEHIIAICTPPFIALIEQSAKDAFHLAHKGARDADIAAVHFLHHAFHAEPKTHEQWHDIGHNLAILVLAITGS